MTQVERIQLKLHDVNTAIKSCSKCRLVETRTHALCGEGNIDANVSTKPGIAFGPTGEDHLRLSFCVPEEMINKTFDRMERYFKKYSKEGERP